MCQPREYELSKIEAAVNQLDWAIRLFLDHKACIPAITLAAAAEEIIGRATVERRANTAINKHLADELSISERKVSDEHTNFAKNWLKHWDGLAASQKTSIFLADEAVQYIVRALTNLANYNRSCPSQAPRFRAWMEANRPDLMG